MHEAGLKNILGHIRLDQRLSGDMQAAWISGTLIGYTNTQECYHPYYTIDLMLYHDHRLTSHHVISLQLVVSRRRHQSTLSRTFTWQKEHG